MDSRIFLDLVRAIVTDYCNKNTKDGQHQVAEGDVVILWMSQVLQNTKAIVATPIDDRYFELVYDGDKNEIYLATYSKVEDIMFNIKYTDDISENISIKDVEE